MKKFIFTIITIFAFTLIPLTPVAAVDVFQDCTAATQSTAVCKASKTDSLFGPNGIWTRILNTFTYIIGSVAILMLIIGGLRYVTSNGDSTQLTSAKNTILYAIVGVVLAVMANAIVNFVLTNI
jgi:hypothetical protein